MRESRQTLIKTPLCEFGIFRADATFPGETRTSVARSHLIAFPRGASRIRQAGRAAQVATPVGTVFYNIGCEYTAKSLDTSSETTAFLRLGTRELKDAIATFDPSVAERQEAPFSLTGGPLPDSAFFAQTALAHSASRFEPLAAEEALLALAGAVVRAAYAECPVRVSARRGKSDRDYTHWTQELIASTFRLQHGLAEIAERVGVSPFHLCRVFKREVGMTIHEFRDRFRLRAALREMIDSKTPIAQIAAGVGYSSQSHFTDAFRTRFGLPPAECRKRLRAGVISLGAYRKILED